MRGWSIASITCSVYVLVRYSDDLPNTLRRGGKPTRAFESSIRRRLLNLESVEPNREPALIIGSVINETCKVHQGECDAREAGDPRRDGRDRKALLQRVSRLLPRLAEARIRLANPQGACRCALVTISLRAHWRWRAGCASGAFLSSMAAPRVSCQSRSTKSAPASGEYAPRLFAAGFATVGGVLRVKGATQGARSQRPARRAGRRRGDQACRGNGQETLRRAPEESRAERPIHCMGRRWHRTSESRICRRWGLSPPRRSRLAS